jgi:two-component system KDP operon response regulator KdpE
MHTAMRILVVEDDAETHRLVKGQLEEDGHEVKASASGADALESLQAFTPELVLAGVSLPDMDGFDLVHKLKAARAEVPVLFLARLDDADGRASAFRGCDKEDLVQTNESDELCAHLGHVLRDRSLQPQDQMLIILDKDLSLDLRGLVAHTAKGTVELTMTEARLLYHLAQAAGRPVPARTLLSRVWNQAAISEEALRATIHRLRRKFEPDPGQPRYLLTKTRIGYLLAIGPDLPALTEQQTEVLRLVAQGNTDNEAAIALGISSRTVGTHMQMIRNTLGASSRAHAIAVAMSYGLLSRSDVEPRAPPTEK